MSIFGAIGALFGVVGGLAGAAKDKKASKKLQKAEKAASKIRQAMTALEYKRKTRELIRESIVQQAEIENNANSLGVSYKDSSVKSGIGGVQRNVKQDTTQLRQDYDLAKKMFAVNSQFAAGQALQQKAQGIRNITSGVGALISSLG